MRKTDINNGIKDALIAGAPSVDFVWPNVRAEFDRTYVTTSFTVQSRVDNSLKGGDHILRENGLVVLVVVTETNQGEDEANDLAQDLADLFPMGEKIGITDGEITISRAPAIRGGFKDGSEWRVPVEIPYVARSLI